MATINKPQYQTNATQSYNVTPAQEAYRGPDQNAGAVDMSNAKMFETLVDGIGVFADIYAQSEKTANILQAKGILIDKMKNIQNVKETLLLNLKETPFKDLKLKEMLDNYQKVDKKTGKSKLYIGKGLETNISSMQMPEDISPEVKELIEEDFLRMDMSIIESIIGGVGTAQSEQSSDMISAIHSDAMSNLYQVYQSPLNSRFKNKKANEIREKYIAELDDMQSTMAWSATVLKTKKEAVGQIMLQEEFDADFYKLDKEEVLEKARSQGYFYENEKGEKKFLSPDYFKAKSRTSKDALRDKDIIKKEKIVVEEQTIALIRYLKGFKGLNIKDTDKAFAGAITSGHFNKLSSSVLYKAIDDQQVENVQKDNKITDRKQADVLRNTLSELTAKLTITEDFKKNIPIYLDKDGKLKSNGEIQKIPGHALVQQADIRKFMTAQEVDKTRIEEGYKLLINSNNTKEFIATVEAMISDTPSRASLIKNFGKVVKGPNGREIIIVDEALLTGNGEGANLLRQFKLDEHPAYADKSRTEIIRIKKSLIQNLLNKAVAVQEEIYAKDLRDEKAAEMTEDDMTRWYESANYNAVRNHENSIQGKKTRNFTDNLKGKKPTDWQLIQMSAFELTLSTLSDIAKDEKKYPLQELESRIDELSKDLINGSEVGDETWLSIIRPYMKEIKNSLDRRKTLLKTDPRDTLFEESGNGELPSGGVYDVDAYFKKREELGLFNPYPQMLPTGQLQLYADIKKLKSMEEVQNLFQSSIGIIAQYGDDTSRGADMAYHDIMRNIDPDFKSALTTFISEPNDTRIFKIVQSLWMKDKAPITKIKGK